MIHFTCTLKSMFVSDISNNVDSNHFNSYINLFAPTKTQQEIHGIHIQYDYINIQLEIKMGVSVEQWRCSIGSFYPAPCTRPGKEQQADSNSSGCDSSWFDWYRSWFNSQGGMRSITGVRLIVFVCLLMLCGDINPNPGPTYG